MDMASMFGQVIGSPHVFRILVKRSLSEAHQLDVPARGRHATNSWSLARRGT